MAHLRIRRHAGGQKGTEAAPPERAPLPPGTPPSPAGDHARVQSFQTEGVPCRYVKIPTPLPNARFFNRVAYAKHHKRDEDVIPDLLTIAGTTTC